MRARLFLVVLSALVSGYMLGLIEANQGLRAQNAALRTELQQVQTPIVDGCTATDYTAVRQ